MHIKPIALLGLGLMMAGGVMAQMENKAADVPTDLKTHWHHADPRKDQLEGVSTHEAYEIVKTRTTQTVVVAIIDSGVDIEHEDLKDKLWINQDEIPGNGIDDDQNGFVDDVHGWNFLGNAKGENIVDENIEATRIYRQYRDRFENHNASEFSGKALELYHTYVAARDDFMAQRQEMQQYGELIDQIIENRKLVVQILTKELGEGFSLEDVQNMKPTDSRMSEVKRYYLLLDEQGIDEASITEQKEHIDDQLEYHLNVRWNPRADILGDDPESLDYGQYGNNDVIGGKENAEHGTHVAGIVGANRNNGLGVEGIVANVQLMVLRAVPNGDERDKDVANAIRYAVDNGAKVINMSFGKAYSPQRYMVDDAIRYAEEKGVLLIHAAGNDAQNNDARSNYPNDQTAGLTNWVEVGASSAEDGLSLPAKFSNYGRSSVDVFAPGVDIYSTLPSDEYGKRSGTSMASPVVTGIAALVWSYYPELTASQLKMILQNAAVPHGKEKVYIPIEEGKAKKTRFKKLSITGGVVNAVEAMKMAETL